MALDTSLFCLMQNFFARVTVFEKNVLSLEKR